MYRSLGDTAPGDADGPKSQCLVYLALLPTKGRDVGHLMSVSETLGERFDIVMRVGGWALLAAAHTRSLISVLVAKYLL